MSGNIWKHLTVYIWVPLWVNLWVRSWNWVTISACFGFPGSSAGKESACHAGDPGSIPGLGRCPGEGIGYPLQDSWASLVAQTVKNPPAMWQIWVRYLGQEDPLEGGLATHSSILAWRIPTDRRAWQLQLQSMGSQRVGHDWATNTDTHTQTQTHTSACLCETMNVLVHACECMCFWIWVWGQISVCLVSVRECVCMSTYLCVTLYVWACSWVRVFS